MTPGGKLILNRSLIRASVDAIDYVITHELCSVRGADWIIVLERGQVVDTGTHAEVETVVEALRELDPAAPIGGVFKAGPAAFAAEIPSHWSTRRSQ